MDRSLDLAECPICFDDLTNMETEKTVCVLIRTGVRTCNHYFHTQCVDQVLGPLTANVCPLCRKPFDARLEIPDPELDPDGWFNAVDLDRSGNLSMSEVGWLWLSLGDGELAQLLPNSPFASRRWRLPLLLRLPVVYLICTFIVDGCSVLSHRRLEKC